ncbi:MAG: response regulator [Salinivirgaceae bacterium]|nr:response regulator [Salinivirgaceae bacterium]MDD4746799.1 response regulator [Salinivirgaceae bacterium]MDY0282255.1 response regulator [Salinivirgaceae bacterium]
MFDAKKPKILYVDDEEINLRVFKSTFRRDFDVTLAQSAKDGFELFSNNDFDVIITDQRMPEMTGVELLKKIHETHPGIPPNRLILSGFSKDEDVDRAFNEYQLFSFVSKPWDANDLKTLILKAIEHGKA